MSHTWTGSERPVETDPKTNFNCNSRDRIAPGEPPGAMRR